MLANNSVQEHFLKSGDLPTRFAIGNIEVDRNDRSLSSGQGFVRPEPQLFNLLIFFADNHQQTLSREFLVKNVWQGRVISDNAVNRSISQLRKLCQKLDPSVEYLETIPKAGYKLTQSPIIAPHYRRNIKSERVLMALFAALAMVVLFSYQPLERIAPGELMAETTEPGREYSAAISNDGRQLAYLHQAGAGSQTQVLIKDMNTGQSEKVFASDIPLTQLHWSKDQFSLFWVTHNPSTGQCSIEQYNLSKSPGKPNELTSCLYRSSIKIAVGSKALYFVNREAINRPYSVFRFDFEVGESHQLTLPTQDISLKGDFNLTLSADEQYLAVSTYNEFDSTTITVFEVPSMNKISEEDLAVGIKDLHWGKSLNDLFFSDYSSIYHYDPVARRHYKVQKLNQEVVDVDYDHTNEHILTSVQSIDIDLAYREFAQDGERYTLVDSSSKDMLPRVSPDGSKIAYMSNRLGQHEIWLYQQDKSPMTLTSLPFDPGFIKLEWSPNSDQIVFTHKGAVYIVNVADGQLHKVLPESSQAYVANWGNSANELLFSSEKSGHWQIYQYSLSTAELLQLSANGGYSGLKLSDDSLIFTKYYQPGLFRLVDGQEHKLANQVSIINWLNLQQKNNTVYFYNPQTRSIDGFDVQSGHINPVWSVPSNFINHFSVGPDGKGIFYSELADVQGQILRLVIE